MSFEASLSQEIQKSYTVLVQLVSQIPVAKRNSISDIIAYQIGWGKLLIGWYEAGIQDKMPYMPGEGFSKWDYNGLAKHFHQKYHLDGATKQMALFQATVERIIAIVETEHEANQLDTTGVWDWCTLKSGKQWPLRP